MCDNSRVKNSNDDEAKHTVSDEPVGKLDQVEFSTREDDEDVLFEATAKLYIFVNDRMKERATGRAKLLKHKKGGFVRFLLRRDITHIIASNHRIISGMKLRTYSNERVFSWMTSSDFVGGASNKEVFKIRFITVEAATEFKAKFEESVKADVSSDHASENNQKSRETEDETVQPSLSLARPSIWSASFGDTWECQGCLCSYKRLIDICPACGMGKDGSVPAPEVKAASTTTLSCEVSPPTATSATGADPPKETGPPALSDGPSALSGGSSVFGAGLSSFGASSKYDSQSKPVAAPFSTASTASGTRSGTGFGITPETKPTVKTRVLG
ncbi:hypothetical protein SARC_15107, partial [Sphaeroforma arctica JP610]